MDGNLAALMRPDERAFDHAATSTSTEQVIEFYDEAGSDYRHWSRGLNMHLGYYRWGLNPFDREAMLEQLNLEVASRLRLRPTDTAFLIDLGCGTGAIARCIAAKYSNSIIKGVTIVPSQVKTAVELNADAGLQNQIDILHGDYTALPFRDGAADGVWAVESACYADGGSKENLMREMSRVLKVGGHFVVADCFITQPQKKMNALVAECYSTLCKNWAVPELPDLDSFVAELRGNGFVEITVEDISWRTAPSLAHAPFAVLTFILKKLLNGERLKQHSINNLTASLLAPVLGMNRSKFSYCLISGRRG